MTFRLNLLVAAGLLLVMGMLPVQADTTTNTPKYTDVTIPDITTVVENFSVYVQLPAGWSPTPYEIVFQLEGGTTVEGSTTWVPINGTGPQGHTVVELSTDDPTRVNVVVPKFSINTAMTEFRLLFGTNYGANLGTYQNLGTIALTDESHDNSGSMPGHTYVLEWAPDNGINPLSPKAGGTDALKTPANPPKLSVLNGKTVFEVWDESSKAYAPFFVRGMAYEVTPVGQPWPDQTVVSAPGEDVYLADFNTSGGGQICAPMTVGPFGESGQSYCFDTDLTGKMHTYLNTAALPAAEASNALLPSLWDRDLKMLQAMGVNTIRIYHTDTLVRDMTAFLDMALAHGIYVIMPAPAPNSAQTFESSPLTGQLLDWSQMTSSSNGQPWSALMQLSLARYGAHPAILAWAVGNETDADNGAPARVAKTEWVLAKTIKDFGPALLVTSTNQDHYNAASNFQSYYEVFEKYETGTDTYLDFYSINSYRGISDTALRLNGMQTLFNLLDGLQPPYDLPLLISEWGKYDTNDWGTFDNSWGIARMWRMMLTTSSDILGMSYFQFSDEPVAKNLSEQHYMGVVAYALPSNYSPANPMVNDVIQPKFQSYAGIKVIDEAKSTETGKTVYFQNYPAVKQAGIFSSFVGDNTNALTKDAGMTTVPNISYCAFSTSPSPWSINSKCLALDVKVQPTANSYTVSVAAAGGDSVTSMELNGKTITNASVNVNSGMFVLQITGNNSNTATVKFGFDTMGAIPAENQNTLLAQGLQGAPTFTWSEGNTTLNVALPPVVGDS